MSILFPHPQQGPGLVNHKVKVVVRLRPFIEREKLEGGMI